MKDRIIVVTGATGALGGAVVEAAARAGAQVASLARRPGSGPTFETSALWVGDADLSTPEGARLAMTRVAETLGGIDALINTVGGFASAAIGHDDEAVWTALYAQNVTPVLNACRAALPHLQRSHAGRIVNIGAQSALTPGAGLGPYAASKLAVHALTQALAAEARGRPTVNAVLPTTIDTPANRTAMPDADRSRWVPLPRLAMGVLALASAEVADINGALVPFRN
ncbi:MAG: SDR family NAD(P)-dependent oxidoreductase [Caulobacter sp.]|nr:SDR family NAD(P)-dependent oxidoreductase [Caulobacter sp.]